MSAKRRRFIPSFDRLEDRWVPAGDITTRVLDGVLYISGDDEANSISIVGHNDTNAFTLSGNDTTINGQSSERAYTGIKSITINMKGGDDTVSVKDVSLKNAIEFQLGDGDDTLTIDHLHTRRISAIYGQAGDDNISITNSDFHRAMYVWMGAGDDTFNMINNFFGKHSGIHGGQGSDTRTYSGNSFGRDSWIDGFETFTKVDGTLPQAVADIATVDQGSDVTINLAANDTTPSGTLDLTSIVISTQPAHGTVTVHDDGTVTYTQNGSAFTTDSFQYTIKNSNNKTSTPGTVSITINPVDQAPIANNDTANVAHGGSVDISVAANDTDPEGQLDFTTITFTQQPAHGTVSLNNNGTVKYTHDGTATTSDTFKYTIKDLSGHVSNEATVTITIAAGNSPPVAINDTGTVDEGGNVNIAVAGNDTDSDGTLDLTSISFTQLPLHGSVVLQSNGQVKYTHDGSETTTDTFKYTIKDNNAATSNEATVTITITPVNDPPVAQNDTATVTEGGFVTINVAGNDTDNDDTIDLTSIVITQQPQHGILTVNTDGTVKYTHDGSETSPDTFKYTIKDAAGATSNEATVTITINPVNDPPVAVDDAFTIANGGAKTINVAANDTDVDGTIDPATITIIQQPQHGTLTVHPDGTVTYVHDGSATTTDNFIYTIKDNSAAVSNQANVTITIAAGNAPPVANDDSDTINEGTSKVINLTSNDTDSDGTVDPATIVITVQPQHGTVTVHDDGTVTYTHDGSETTSDSFKYTVRDNLGSLSNEATVTLTIAPVNDPPVAVNDNATVDEGGNVIIPVSTNDTDVDGTIDPATIIITQQPQHGILTVNTDGTVKYVHDGSETTTDSFKYTIKDNNGAVSNEATVSITINPVNDPPVAVNDVGNINQGGSVIVNVVANDTDADGTIDVATVIITQQPQHGTVTVHPDGTVTYQHDGTANFSDTFSYTVKDNNGTVSNEATATITIAPNQPPVAHDDSGSLSRGGSRTINLAVNDTDPEGNLDLASIVIVQQPQHGTVQVNSNGTVKYIHNGTATTGDTFTYTIKDSLGAVSNEATVTLTIAANLPPVANNDVANLTVGHNTIVINLAANDTDSDGSIDLGSIVIVSGPSHGTLIVNDDGTVTYMFDGSNVTSDTFTYTIKDNFGLVSNIASVLITISSGT